MGLRDRKRKSSCLLDSQALYVPLTQLNIYTLGREECDTGGRDFTCPTALETRRLGSKMSCAGSRYGTGTERDHREGPSPAVCWSHGEDSECL